jgi:hypothetical protein
MMASLDYFGTYGGERLPANLVQVCDVLPACLCAWRHVVHSAAMHKRVLIIGVAGAARSLLTFDR